MVTKIPLGDTAALSGTIPQVRVASIINTGIKALHSRPNFSMVEDMEEGCQFSSSLRSDLMVVGGPPEKRRVMCSHSEDFDKTNLNFLRLVD